MPFPVGKHYTAEEFFALHPEESNSERYELMNGEIIALAAPTLEHQGIVGGIYRRIGNFIDSRKGKEQMNEYNQIPLRGERKCGCESRRAAARTYII